MGKKDSMAPRDNEDGPGGFLAPVQSVAATKAATTARAREQTRFQVAMYRPRNMERVKAAMLEDCANPEFARAARFGRQIGDKLAEGWSIRFAESARQHFGNLYTEVQVVEEDDDHVIVEVIASDLEANVGDTTQLRIKKSVERSSRAGRKVISERINAENKTVWVVEPTEEELINKITALTAKVKRNAIVALMPRPLLQACLHRIQETLREHGDGIDLAKKDPVKETSALLESFERVKVSQAELEGYLGHKLDFITPDDVVDLRKIYTSIRKGSTWTEATAEPPQ